MGAMKDWAAEHAPNDDLAMCEFSHYSEMTELERAEYDCWAALSAFRDATKTLKRIREKNRGN